MLKAETGVVVSIESVRPGAQEIVVAAGGQPERAIAYPSLTGKVNAGDRVMLNTTAVRMGLGSGGLHFVMKRIGGQGEPEVRKRAEPAAEAQPEPRGHVIKLRYTPLQFACLAAEEPESPHHAALRIASNLRGAPVIASALHSMIAPAAAGVKAAAPGLRVAYVMTDAAALPLAVSRLVPQLAEAGLLDATITCGQAFGGDYEAVNLFSGLLVAKVAAGADVIIAGQGPGNVGTATLYGFGGIEVGEIINAASVLGGRPVAMLRISFADPRERHRVVSHHSLVALGRAALARATVVVPEMADDHARQVREKLAAADIPTRHEIVTESGEAGLAELAERGVEIKSMGRGVADDRDFFLAAAAAGEYAARILEKGSE
jgi:hypothetical protein